MSYNFHLSSHINIKIKIPCNNIFQHRLNFPEIFVNMPESYNAWIQIVRTDSDDKNLQFFIDCNKTLCPIYSTEDKFGPVFYDYPEWYYKYNQTPIHFWIAHTYPVKIDKITNKVIKIGEGFEWGFNMKKSFFKSIYLIEPSIILHTEQKLDIAEFKKRYKNYF